MSDARTHREYEHRTTLRNAGWDVPKADGVRFNSGSETLEHFLAKASIAWVLKQDGYRIASEVTDSQGRRELDLVAYGTEDVPVIIEVEKDMQREVMLDKLERYCENEPFRDMLTADVDTMPAVEELEVWAGRQV